jgi:2-methylfumaryl-CoA isomerase
MVCALTKRHWADLLRVTGMREVVAGLEQSLGADFSTEDDRFEYREVLAGLLSRWFARHDLAQVQRELAGSSLLWSTYNTFTDLVADDLIARNPMMDVVDQPGVGRHLAPRIPLALGSGPRAPVTRAPVLGEHTAEVLRGTLGLSGEEVSDLAQRGVVGPLSVREPVATSASAGPTP